MVDHPVPDAESGSSRRWWKTGRRPKGAPWLDTTREGEQPDGWREYLDAFHAHHPGITAEVLGRSFSDGVTPYGWLTAAIPPDDTVIDVGCGSSPIAELVGSRWIGVDRSASEVALAGSCSGQPLVLGDAPALPFPAQSVTTIVCSMSLQILDPLVAVLGEFARVLRPGGRVVAIVPARRPLTWSDRWRYLRLSRTLRDGLTYPNDVALSRLAGVMGEAGFDVVDDQARRFLYRVDDAAGAAKFVSSLYARSLDAKHTTLANALVAGWVGTSLAIPIRRFVCVRRPADNPRFLEDSIRSG